MTGYFNRLASRAQGGSALAGLTLVKPLASIYVDHERHGLEAEAAIESSPATQSLSGIPDDVPIDQEPAISPSHPLPPTSAKNEPEKYSAFEERAEADHSIHRVQAQRPDRQPSLPDAVPDRHVEQQPEITAAIAETGHEDDPGQISALTSIASVETATAKRSSYRPVPNPRSTTPTKSEEVQTEPQPEAEQIVQNEHSLERLFQTIEETSFETASADGAVPNIAFDSGPIIDTRPATEIPNVSIGRIDISVAPPVEQHPPQRTQGFQNYARLRRGLER